MNFVKTLQTLIILSISVIVLSGCGGLKRVDVKVEEQERAPLVLPLIDEYNPEGFFWYVITEDNIEQKFKELQEQGYDPVFFALTDEGYEKIAINQAKMLQLMKQFKATIEAMEEYYTEDVDDGTGSSSEPAD